MATDLQILKPFDFTFVKESKVLITIGSQENNLEKFPYNPIHLLCMQND